MKIILSQYVMLKNIPRTSKLISKTIESSIIPHTGDYISDVLWKNPYEYPVLKSIINYELDECYVELPSYELESENEETIKEFIKMSKSHGWE